MTIKIDLFLFAAFLLAAPGCRAEENFKGNPPTPFTAAQYLKNYGLSSCLADGMTSKEAKKDAEDAAAGYLELGSFGIEAYQEVAQAGRKYLEKKYLSYGGGKLITMRCINFFYSKELNTIVKKHSSSKNKNSHH